jgi:RsiW-degrading membrane proteinase PrsW (M82 family)
VPRRFFLGTFALYAMFLGTFLLSASPLQRVIPHVETAVPLVAGFSFYLSGNLFLLILGRGHVSRWTVLLVILSTLVLASTLCLALRASMVYPAVDPDSASGLRTLLKHIAELVNRFALPAPGQRGYLKLIAMVIVEETIKLLPVFVLIALRRIRTAHAGMLCGALAGLTFGIVEGITFGYLEYSSAQRPLTTYLTRFLVMAPQHAVWDALAGGIIFFVGDELPGNASRRPTARACATGFAWAVVFHVCHNGLQAMLGPFTQVATVFGLMMPLYLLAKAARRRSAMEDFDSSRQIFGDLHVLTISIGTLFLAGSAAFSRTAGRTARLLEDQSVMTDALADLQHASTVRRVDAARAELLRSSLVSDDPELARIRDRVLASAATLSQLDAKLHFLGNAGSDGQTFISGTDGVPSAVLDRGVDVRQAYLLLDDCRLRLNRFAARRDLPRPYPPIGHWLLTVRSMHLSAPAAARCLRDEPLEHAAPDPYVMLATARSDNAFQAVAQSPAPMSDTLSVAFSPPWTMEASMKDDRVVLCLIDDDGPDACGELLDIVELPRRSFSGELEAAGGSTIAVEIQYDSD